MKSEGERMSKEQREKAGYKRMTAYCVSEGFKMKLLTGFLKREHNVQLRVFDEAVYVVRILSKHFIVVLDVVLEVSSAVTAWLWTWS